MDAQTRDDARNRWRKASQRASDLEAQLFQPGSGYGDPEARLQDQHQLDSARQEAARLLEEYIDIDRRYTDERLFKLQESQTRATWASFAVAATVGLATVISLAVNLFG